MINVISFNIFLSNIFKLLNHSFSISEKLYTQMEGEIKRTSVFIHMWCYGITSRILTHRSLIINGLKSNAKDFEDYGNKVKHLEFMIVYIMNTICPKVQWFIALSLGQFLFLNRDEQNLPIVFRYTYFKKTIFFIFS